MKDITIKDFCDKNNACQTGRDWAKKHCKTGMMSEAYAKLSKAKIPAVKEFWDWTWCRAFDDKTLRLLSVRMARETPLADGRKVFDLLTDERSINALVVAEKFALGLASQEELAAAGDAGAAAWAAAWAAAGDARAAARAAWAAAWAAAVDAQAAARAAAWAAAGDAGAAAGDAAGAAQRKIILELGNPFMDC